MKMNPYIRMACLIIWLIMSGTATSLKLSPQAAWNSTGITVAGSPTGVNGSAPNRLHEPLGISISANDVLYVSDTLNHRIVVVDSGISSTRGQFSAPRDLFIFSESLYVLDVGASHVSRRFFNDSNPIVAINSTEVQFASYLYVDKNGRIYLSVTDKHQVLLFDSDPENGSRVAGTGVNGSNIDQLQRPYGVFVNDAGAIYIADCFNHRIMKWLPRGASGTRVAGDGTPGGSLTQLSLPTDVIVDANEYIYVSEATNSRITQWASNCNVGVCIAGCTGVGGATSSQLNGPHSLEFDRNGSLYVADYGNHRIQKFQLLNFPIPYNQPNINRNATWDRCAITFVNRSILDFEPRGFFIDWNDTVYATDYVHGQILVWSNDTLSLRRNLTVQLYSYTSPFVAINGDIYFENRDRTGQIDKWTRNSTDSIMVTRFSSHCNGLYVDSSADVYCSMWWKHQVVKATLIGNTRTLSTIAGTGSNGSNANQLSHPWGIFVDVNFDLYVADCYNNRIQLFRSERAEGETVAGKSAPNGLQLNGPTDVVLDGNGFMYIADNKNHRIIRVGENKFQCIAGCTGRSGSASNELFNAYAVRLDSAGHLYVADEKNYRIQKFRLAEDSCDRPLYFIPRPCTNSTNIGTNCSVPNTSCDALSPCLNNGTCTNINSHPGYHCSCPSGFNGVWCQFDNRPCKSDTCFNNGKCNVTSNCICAPGWEGKRCERKINFCLNVTCANRGVCRPLLLNYSCECLTGSFSGRHCEITATRVVNFRAVSKSMAYIAIIALVTVGAFVLIMDVLKYYFGIDPTRDERARIRREKRERKRRLLARRLVYANIMPSSAQSK